MLRGKWNLWVAAAAVTALLAGGCCQDEKNQIASLTRERDDLKTSRDGLLTQLTALDAERDTVNALRTELANKDQEISGLKLRLSQVSTRPGGGTAGGWTEGVFGDQVTIGADLLFASGKADLTAAGRGRLDRIVQDIKSHYAGKTVRVFGHTDRDPIKRSPWDDNLELSANRALAVTRYLIARGIRPALIESVAMGEFHPEGTDKARNRRVEIYVVKAKQAP